MADFFLRSRFQLLQGRQFSSQLQLGNMYLYFIHLCSVRQACSLSLLFHVSCNLALLLRGWCALAVDCQFKQAVLPLHTCVKRRLRGIPDFQVNAWTVPESCSTRVLLSGHSTRATCADDLALQVFELVSQEDKLRLSLVCKPWRKLLAKPTALWQTLAGK